MMTNTITLSQLEAIDGAYIALGALDDGSREYIKASNHLFDLCVEAIGYQPADAFSRVEECAAWIINKALLSADFVKGE